ncbi:hypothetical protein [Isoptericola aurantiacus]|uniref:hypothetical protein n=1 Tax=Isoptericola aurantiacus TaxID=3377839 RepID=UPI00383A8AEE
MTSRRPWAIRMDQMLAAMKADPEAYLDDARREAQGKPHDHTERVPGCFRCDLAADETEQP